MLLDVENALDLQDLRIINLIEKEGRCLILALNKWDIENNKKEKINKLKNKIKLSLPQFGNISIVTISALRNEGTEKLYSAIVAAKKKLGKKICHFKVKQMVGNKNFRVSSTHVKR